jgi:hypothetical protein
VINIKKIKKKFSGKNNLKRREYKKEFSGM